MKAIRIDKDGFFIEDIEVKADQTNTKEIIVTHCENGFYKPKWNGTKWVEGLSQAELDEIEYHQYLDSLKPKDEDLKNAQLELLMLDLLIDTEVLQ